MNEQESAANEKMNQSWIVISDTHIGGNPKGSNVPNDNDICCFLNWIKHLNGKGERIWVKKDDSGYEKTILSPSKMILLGDILDLWDPEESDRSYVTKNASLPFAILQDIECNKVYVVGNHDQDLYELADILEKDNEALCLNDWRLEVSRRHYPFNVDYGIRIGNLKYAFIHGHQYDKVQITEPISKKIGIRFDPLDVIQDICNISIVKSVFIKKRPTAIYFSLLTMILAWILYQGFPGNLEPFLKILQPPYIRNFLIYLLKLLWVFLWASIVSFFFLTPLVKAIAKYQGPLWKYLTIKPRDKTIEQVIKGGYYKESSDTMKVDVVVFGHTHIAGSYYLESKNRLFVNTGAWLKETDGRKLNTFAYIDADGIDVLSWTGTKKDGRYVFEHVCSHTASSLKNLSLQKGFGIK
jgi:predicted phosphodiesterase